MASGVLSVEEPFYFKELSMANDQVFTAEAPQRSGCGRIFFIGSGCGCLLLLVVCCGILGVGAYSVPKMASMDPVRVKEVREQIAEVQIPEEFTPAQSFDLTIPVLDQKMLTWSVYEGRDDSGVLVLAEFGRSMAATVDDAIRELENSLAQQGTAPKELEINEDETDKQEFVIRDQPSEFIFAKGKEKDSDDDREYWFVTGTFPGREGKAVLLLIVDAEKLSREQIVELIQSIK